MSPTPFRLNLIHLPIVQMSSGLASPGSAQPPPHRGVFSQPSSECWCSRLWASVSSGMGLPVCLCPGVPTTGTHACMQ